MINTLFFKFNLIIGKLIIFILKIFKKGRATALPGLIIEKLNPSFIQNSTKYFERIIVVSGTNGKTSFQTLLSKVLEQFYKEEILVNSRGSNLKRGLISQILKDFNIVFQKKYKYVIFEIEEATLPKIVNDLNPDIFIITNFFRDQLDAYGEIERTKKHIFNALKKCPNAQIVANGDDPHVLDILKNLKNNKKIIQIENAHKFIKYETIDKNIPINHIENKDIEIFTQPHITNNLKTKFQYKSIKFNLNMPGFYSYYAFAFVMQTLNILNPELNHNINDLKKLSKIIGNIKQAFGRGENLKINHNNIQLFLVKNPIGFNITLDTFSLLDKKINLIILINDKIADGKDVSWLWDSKLEKLKKINYQNIFIGGTRKYDMLLRIKYIFDKTKKNSNFYVIKDYENLLNIIQNKNIKNIKAIATYTAMNEFRDFIINSHQ